MKPRADNATPEPLEVRAQLERILASPPFRSSRRCSDFLRYVVLETCEGREDRLKERALGAAIFHRDPAYDTNQDPVVRNTAGQVRKRLAQYYFEPARAAELRIDLPPGSYVPEIQYPPVSPEPEPVPVPQPPPPSRRLWWAAGGLLLASALAFAFALLSSKSRNSSNLDLFWKPLLERSGPVVLCVGQGHTFKLAGDLDKLFDDPSLPRPASIPFPDLIPAFDRYVGLTDVRALMQLYGMFNQRGKAVELRAGRTTSLADLRGKPAVLIGAFNNQWTLSLTGELRFYFEEDPSHNETVRDRLHPDNRSWQVRSDVPVEQVPVDYAIVTRVFNTATEQPVVVAAGIRGGGTMASSEFITNASYLEQALKQAPPDWPKKNIQVVLATKMFSGNPGPASVVAVHFW